MPRLGRHMPLDPNPLTAFSTAQSLGCTAIQIFVGNPRGWAIPSANPKTDATWIERLNDLNLAPITIHAAYLINLASATEITRSRSQELLRWTMQRGAALGAEAVVMHIGSHGGNGEVIGIERLESGIRAVLKDLEPGPRLLLENDVGAGKTIGSHFEAMAEVLARLDTDQGNRLGVCLDTAHLWGAGHDIGSSDGTQATLDMIDAAFGLNRVHVIHLNDTSVALGSHRDLHKRLGEGIIGTEGLRKFLNDPRLAQATVLLETPIKTIGENKAHDWDDDSKRIAYAQSLLEKE
jgi:deoxyribonuclease-4